MIDAVNAAARDAGSASLLAAADRIVVPKGTWSYTDPGRLVAAAIGANRARTWLVDIGIPQQTLINDALRAILQGECEVVVVAGGEARRRAQRAGRGGAEAAETDQQGAEPDRYVSRPEGELIAAAELAARVVAPVEQYALMENALRWADGQSIADHATSIARLWAGFNAVARSNPWAAFPAGMDVEAIATATEANRPLAFPYNKWHASQWTVDQAGALIFCSASAPRRHGVPEDRWVFPLAGLESSAAVSLSRRRDLHAWPAMAVLGRAAALRLGRPLAEVEHIELYSCFPAAVRIQHRELDLSADAVPSFTGGMTFAGGPFNNFVLQATAELVSRLRGQPEAAGLVTSVSGMLTKPGLAVWSARTNGEPPLLADLAQPALAGTKTLDIADDYSGPATVASYTVTYQGMAPARVVVIGDTAGGERCVAVAHDPELAAHAVRDEFSGAPVHVGQGSFDA
jgi:acetyl-CoA C-acetyltransferase